MIINQSHAKRIMIFLLLWLVAVIGVYAGDPTDDVHITVNTRTGFVSLSSLPQVVHAGDKILLCIPPGYSEACDFIREDDCIVSDESCQFLEVPAYLPHDSAAMLIPQGSVFKANKIQPVSDPVVHCFLMFEKHSHLLNNCVRQMKQFNTTHGPADMTLFHLPAKVPVIVIQQDQEINGVVLWLVFGLQLTIFFSFVMLYLLKANLLTLFN